MTIVNPNPTPAQIAAAQTAAKEFLKANGATDPDAAVVFPQDVARNMVKYGLALDGDWGKQLLAGFGDAGNSLFAFFGHARVESTYVEYATQKTKAGLGDGAPATVTPKQALLLHAQIEALQTLVSAKDQLIARLDAQIASLQAANPNAGSGGSGGPGVIK
jgi:hypothetical protein